MKQSEALAILESGQSVLLTGAAGSGKTYVLNKFIRMARADGKKVAVTATTGLAATHLSGTTIHAWCGIGIRDELPGNFYQSLSEARKKALTQADILILDEVSMLHDFRLDMVDHALQLARLNSEPFGGMQVVLCGDFFQLPPVNRRDSRQGGFITESKVWQTADFAVCYLHEQHRQLGDGEFTAILNAIRSGGVSAGQLAVLQARIGATMDEHVTPTRLHTTNMDVDTVNQRALDALPGDTHIFDMTTSGKANYVEQLMRSCLAPKELHLKKNALVMCIKNSLDMRYANGSLGTVIGFDSDTGFPEVELLNGRTLTITPDSWELMDGDTRRAQLTQLPLRLAWAITIHKSQGMTLDAARIDLSRAFVEGMGYVALSRVRSLQYLVLQGLNSMALRVSPAALAIDQNLQARSTQAIDKFQAIITVAASRPERPDPPPESSSNKPKTAWSEKLQKMRQEYANAYKPWSKADDEKLKELFEAKTTLKVLTNQFSRHPGSIQARIKKHYGEEATVPK